jgi:hypothetical protein
MVTITIEQFEELLDSDTGICLKCGAERGMCEPDARRYPCDECGARQVYGVEELLQMGHVV